MGSVQIQGHEPFFHQSRLHICHFYGQKYQSFQEEEKMMFNGGKSANNLNGFFQIIGAAF
jgi:hypothetical protein